MSLANTLFSFDGRMSRKTYWLSFVGVFVGIFCLMFVIELGRTAMTGHIRRVVSPTDLIDTLLAILLIVPCTAITVKRLNDIAWPVWLGYASGASMVLFSVAQYFGFDPLIKLTPVTTVLSGIAIIDMAFSIIIGVKPGTSEPAHPLPA
jgi:uncharacterized membrane protein YhaH (DUF805 family)